jgi:putative transposase
MNAHRYMMFMNAMATEAKKILKSTGRYTVVVMDNGSSHKALAVQACWPEWEKKGLFCFFLPPYCSEMNLIEGEWRQLKAYEISGRMFETEQQLSLAIIDGIEHRSEGAGFTPQRFEFIPA